MPSTWLTQTMQQAAAAAATVAATQGAPQQHQQHSSNISTARVDTRRHQSTVTAF